MKNLIFQLQCANPTGFVYILLTANHILLRIFYCILFINALNAMEKKEKQTLSKRS